MVGLRLLIVLDESKYYVNSASRSDILLHEIKCKTSITVVGPETVSFLKGDDSRSCWLSMVRGTWAGIPKITGVYGMEYSFRHCYCYLFPSFFSQFEAEPKCPYSK